MSRWRWVLVALVALGAVVATVPLLNHRQGLACTPEMALKSGLLDGVTAPPGVLQKLAGMEARWEIVGPATPDDWHLPRFASGAMRVNGLATRATDYPWTSQQARALCVSGLPCAMKLGMLDRFALLWARPEGEGYVGELIVQDGPRRRVHLIGVREDTADGATCAALGAWFAFARAELPPPG